MPGGKWLQQVGQQAAKLTGSMVDRIETKINETSDKLQEKLANESTNLGPVMNKFRQAGIECEQAARETMEICNTTNEKREMMIAFGKEIESTLQSLKGGAPASILQTIKELTDGNKVKQAKALVEGLDVAALRCVDNSIRMIDIIEDGMDSLPDFIQKPLENYAASKGGKDEVTRDLITGLDEDIENVKTCIENIKSLNLSTALKVGFEAFHQINEKAIRSKSLFDTICDFAGEVQGITQDVKEMDVMGLSQKSKDMLKCLRYTDLMRMIAEGAGKLLKILIQLFDATSDRISEVWAALAFAKDCMEDSVKYVVDATKLCTDAKEKSIVLIEKSTNIKDNIASIRSIDANSIKAFKALAQGTDIKESILLGQKVAELLLNFDDKVKEMVDRVTEGFANLPKILTEGINIEDEGRRDRDPDPANLAEDVRELEAATRDIEGANFMAATKAGVSGFTSASGKASVCRDMLQQVEKFASGCDETIASFLNVWDLELAANKITEMCRLVSLGQMMKQFALQIKKLVEAIVSLLRSASQKYSKGLENLVDDAAGFVGDAADLVKNKLNFFRK